MANRNKFNSTLLEYTKKNLSYPGRKHISNRILEQALELLDTKLCNCCKVFSYKTNNPFLITFAAILNGTDTRYEREKLLEARSYILLQTSPECC